MISKAGGMIRLSSYSLTSDLSRPITTHPTRPKLSPYGQIQSTKKACASKLILSKSNCLNRSVVNFTIGIFQNPSNQNTQKKPEGDSRFFRLTAAMGWLKLVGHRNHLTPLPLSANTIYSNFLARME